jgi:hypothetical protein
VAVLSSGNSQAREGWNGWVKVSGKVRLSVRVVNLALLFSLVIKIIDQIVAFRLSCHHKCPRCGSQAATVGWHGYRCGG